MTDLVTVPRELLEQAVYALEYASDMTKPDGLSGCDCPICVTVPALKSALSTETERNFCPRCGKRLVGDGIHTCTPPDALSTEAKQEIVLSYESFLQMGQHIAKKDAALRVALEALQSTGGDWVIKERAAIAKIKEAL